MKYTLTVAALAFTVTANAQLRFPADGGSVRGKVAEQIGITDVTIDYGRPAVKGREGHVWGELVPKGFEESYALGNKQVIPWRAGANENTTIEFSTDVIVEGKTLPAGKYAVFMAYDPMETTVIFNRHTLAWGAYFYDDKEDALRVKVKPVALTESVERLTYGFDGQTDSSAVVSLQWEKLKIPFTVSTQLQKLQLETIAKEMRGQKGFYASNMLEAAVYFKEHNINLDQALSYITSASRSMPTFYVFSQKAEILEKMNKPADADVAMKDAIKAENNAIQLHAYSRRLLNEKKSDKAFEYFKLNYEKFPDVYTTNVGMARGYEALGNKKQALKYATKALPQAPDPQNKAVIEEMIKSLKEGKVVKS